MTLSNWTTPEQFFEQIDFLCAFAKSRGIKKLGRLEQMQNILAGFEKDKVLSVEVGIALRDLRQLVLVAECFPNCDDDEFLNKLRKTIKDKVNPDGAQQNTPGRDNQTELYIASTFSRIPNAEVHWEEPDLVVETGSVFYGIAAKRVKSLERIEDRLRDAVKQLRVWGGTGHFSHGLAILDVTHATNPEGLLAQRPHFDPETNAAHELVVKPALESIQELGLLQSVRRIDDGHVFSGVLVVGTTVELFPDVGGFINSQNVDCSVFPESMEGVQLLITSLKQALS